MHCLGCLKLLCVLAVLTDLCGLRQKKRFFSFKTWFLCVAIALAALELNLQTGLVLNSDPPASASQLLELKACTTWQQRFL